ncbi:MAG: pyridoxal-phosphate dependent enzyme [Deltaproteobacteria bacterium]|nr:pyridoxal-phosphate dependent enzyme [Deltaproteobacteria bacterium]
MPTPLVRCESLSALGGVEVDLKRDDLIGDQLTGTKMRALSYIVWQAKEDGVSDLITIGEPTSNQCRLVSMLGARHGMTTHVLLRKSACYGDQEDDNLTIMRMHGARVQFLEEDEWRLHGMTAKRLMSRVRKAGGKALFVPFGCGGLPGALGIIDLVREIVAQHGGRCPYQHIVVPTGSGATLFALDLAMQVLDLDPDTVPMLLGVSVARDAPGLLQQIDKLYAQVRPTLGATLQRTDRLTIDDRWTDHGPARQLEELQRVVGTYGLLPDPLYVLRAVLALERLISSGELASSSRVLLLVTGACRTLHATRQRATETRHATQ